MSAGRRTPLHRWVSLVQASLAEASVVEVPAQPPSGDGTTPPPLPAVDDLIAKAVSGVDRHAANARAARRELDRLRSRAAQTLLDAAGAADGSARVALPARVGLDLRR
jgi:hypothetical protein